MNILFITSSRIGDAILSTGLLDHIAQTYPQAKVTVACGPLCVSLFEGYPLLERIIPLQKQKYNKHWLNLWQKTCRVKWDMIVDLRNSAVSRLLFARKKYIYGRHIDKSLHKVEQNAAIMRLATPPAPTLWFTAAQQEQAARLVPPQNNTTPILAIGPSANWFGKTWPYENFIELIHRLTAKNGLMPGAPIAIFAATGEEETAYKVLNAVAPNRRIDVIAKTDPGTAAAALARCDFYIGNDSGLMHCAAAANIPTIGLFGPSYPHLYRPWGNHTDYARTPESFDDLMSAPDYDPTTQRDSLMTTLSVDAVMAVIENHVKTLHPHP